MLETYLWRGAWGVIHSTPIDAPHKRYTGARHVLTVVLQFFTDSQTTPSITLPLFRNTKELPLNGLHTRMYKLHTCRSVGSLGSNLNDKFRSPNRALPASQNHVGYSYYTYQASVTSN